MVGKKRKTGSIDALEGFPGGKKGDNNRFNAKKGATKKGERGAF